MQELDDDMDFNIVWWLMQEDERKRHLLNGMRQACDLSDLRQDARALCPEITTSVMLSQQSGAAFTMFIFDYSYGVKDAAPGSLSLLRSDWWERAVDVSLPWPEDIQFAFTQLTIQRNQFISE